MKSTLVVVTYFHFFLNDSRLLDETYVLLPEDWTEEQIKGSLEQWVKKVICRHPTSRYSYGWDKQSPPPGWINQEMAKLETQAHDLLRRVEELRTWRQ